MMQHSFFLCKCLHPADVGAVSDRPRAWCSAQRIEISILAGGKYTLIHDNRPYEFYCRFCVFCNTHFTFIFYAGNTLVIQISQGRIREKMLMIQG